MIGLPENVSIYLCTTPVDFRKGFDGLTGIVTTGMNHQVTDGSLFLFVNCKRDRIKALWWETGGLTLWCRRLEQRTVELPVEQPARYRVFQNAQISVRRRELRTVTHRTDPSHSGRHFNNNHSLCATGR